MYAHKLLCTCRYEQLSFDCSVTLPWNRSTVYQIQVLSDMHLQPVHNFIAEGANKYSVDHVNVNRSFHKHCTTFHGCLVPMKSKQITTYICDYRHSASHLLNSIWDRSAKRVFFFSRFQILVVWNVHQSLRTENQSGVVRRWIYN